MSKPIIRIHNAETNEIIDREMNDQEFVEWQAQKEATEAKIQLLAAKRNEALAKLEALGLNQDDLKALGF